MQTINVLRAHGTPTEIPAAARREALRPLWVSALEEALTIEEAADLLSWLARHLRPVLGYGLVICGTGVFTPGAIGSDRLLVRGIARSGLDRLRDPYGVIQLPRGRPHPGRTLRTIDCAPERIPESAWAHTAIALELGSVAVLDQPGLNARWGSYCLFGRLPRRPDSEGDYLAALLAPTFHHVLARVVERDPRLGTVDAVRFGLSRREIDVLHWLVAGRTTQEIAAATQRSTHTIANQVRAILRKLGAANRTEAIALAVGHGLIPASQRPGATRLIAAQTRSPYRR